MRPLPDLSCQFFISINNTSMVHGNKVLRSIQTTDGGHCVDIFMHPDGTFGFQEYRRDVEDNCWFPIGCNSDKLYGTIDAALEEALSFVSWLKDVMHPD